MSTDVEFLTPDQVREQQAKKQHETQTQVQAAIAESEQRDEDGENNLLLADMFGGESHNLDASSSPAINQESAGSRLHYHYGAGAKNKSGAVEEPKITEAKPLKENVAHAEAEVAPHEEGLHENPSLPHENLGVSSHLKGAAKFGAAFAAGDLAVQGLEAYAENRVESKIVGQGTRSDALHAAESTMKGSIGNAVKDAALGLVPYVTSQREWSRGNRLKAIGWGIVDTVGLASLVVPVGGEFVEGAIASAKVAKTVGTAAKVAEAAEGASKVAEVANVATSTASAANVVASATTSTMATVTSVVDKAAQVANVATKANLAYQVGEGAHQGAVFYHGHQELVNSAAQVIISDTLHGGATQQQTARLARALRGEIPASEIITGQGRAFYRHDGMTPPLAPAPADSKPDTHLVGTQKKKSAWAGIGMGMNMAPSPFPHLSLHPPM